MGSVRHQLFGRTIENTGILFRRLQLAGQAFSSNAVFAVRVAFGKVVLISTQWHSITARNGSANGRAEKSYAAEEKA
jgi:hypothetical protein